MVLTVEFVSVVFASVVVAVGVVVWFFRIIGNVKESINTAKKEASVEVDKLEGRLNTHKLHAAETYATKAGLTESLERVHVSVDNLTKRIDVFLNKMPKG